jgi:hypothetical protein
MSAAGEAVGNDKSMNENFAEVWETKGMAASALVADGTKRNVYVQDVTYQRPLFTEISFSNGSIRHGTTFRLHMQRTFPLCFSGVHYILRM